MSAATVFGSDRAAIAPGVARAASWLLLGAFAAIPALNAMTSGRLFRGPVRFADSDEAATLLLAFGLAATAVVLFLAMPVARPAPAPVWLGLIAFFLAPSLSAIARGEPVGASSVAGLLAFSAVAVLPPPPIAWLTRAITTILAAYAFGSLAAAVVAPGWAVQQEFAFASLPGLDSRLYGLTVHANALGPLMVALLLLEMRRERKRPVVIGAAVITLLWTQSRTSWAVFALIAGIEAVRRLQRRSRRPVVPVLAVLAVMVLSVGLAVGVSGGGQVNPRENSVETLTGRTAVWEVTLEVWRQDWFLGYGPRLWDDAMDFKYRHRVGFAPGHAHNQLIHTLGLSGVVGAAALLAYLVALGGLARRGDSVTRGGTTALVSLLVLGSITEVTMPLGIFSPYFLLHLLVFWYVGSAAASADRGSDALGRASR